MIISLIAAMDEDRAIGRENRLPWYLPKDMERFRLLTTGHPVIMGRKTFESIGGPLPDRMNIVISRRPGFRAAGCTVAHDLDAALEACGNAGEVFIAGGAEVYREAMQRADRLYLTLVHTRIKGDAFFPAVPDSFTLASREQASDVFPLEFLVYARRTQP